MAETIVALVEAHAHEFVVLSPALGVVSMRVGEHTLVSGHQWIADFKVLGKTTRLVLPQGVEGQIKSLFSRDRECATQYRQELMRIEAVVRGTEHKKADEKHSKKTINATMDGLFYLSASPKSPAYVAVGQEIQPGQTIGLVEVMKCFYPMKYQGSHSVKIIDILVSNATPVQSGMKIFSVE